MIKKVKINNIEMFADIDKQFLYNDLAMKEGFPFSYLNKSEQKQLEESLSNSKFSNLFLN